VKLSEIEIAYSTHQTFTADSLETFLRAFNYPKNGLAIFSDEKPSAFLFEHFPGISSKILIEMIIVEVFSKNVD
jgi:hypothetical protein